MIVGIILASGFSRRMKKDKLLLNIDGEKLIEKVIRSCRSSNLDKVYLIYRTEEVKKIGYIYGVETIYNEMAHLGQSQSLKLGVNANLEADKYMFFVGDHPFINTELINRLIMEYEQTDLSILVPYYGKNPGMPVIMSSKYKEDILKIQGDIGAREIIRKNSSSVKKIYIDDIRLGLDIDDMEDLKNIINLKNK